MAPSLLRVALGPVKSKHAFGLGIVDEHGEDLARFGCAGVLAQSVAGAGLLGPAFACLVNAFLAVEFADAAARAKPTTAAGQAIECSFM